MKTGTPIYRVIWALWTTYTLDAMWIIQKNPMLKLSAFQNSNHPLPYRKAKFPFVSPHDRIYSDYLIRKPLDLSGLFVESFSFTFEGSWGERKQCLCILICVYVHLYLLDSLVVMLICSGVVLPRYIRRVYLSGST